MYSFSYFPKLSYFSLGTSRCCSSLILLQRLGDSLALLENTSWFFEICQEIALKLKEQSLDVLDTPEITRALEPYPVPPVPNPPNPLDEFMNVIFTGSLYCLYQNSTVGHSPEVYA